MKWIKQRIVSAKFFGLGSWILADLILENNVGKQYRIKARGKFIEAIAKIFPKTDDDPLKYTFKLITIPADIKPDGWIEPINPKFAYVEFSEKMVRLE